MKRFLNVVCVLAFIVSSVFSIETIAFSEYEHLNPDIDLLSDKEHNSAGRSLLFFIPYAGVRTEDAYIYNTSSNTAMKVSSEQIGLYQVRLDFVWDVHNRTNYGYVRPQLSEKEDIRGWYTYTLNSHNKLVFTLQNKNEYWAYRSIPYFQISDSILFASRYRVFKDGVHMKNESMFKITDMYSGQTVWENTILKDLKDSLLTDMYWISGNWLLKNSNPSIAGPWWKTDTIFNYETNEDRSFAPEYIIGYGDGVILTTMETTEEGFKGITVWSVDKEIVYRDKDFPLTGMLGKLFHAIYFSYFDYPYVYCNIMRLGAPYCTLILNLSTGQTYTSPLGYHLRGIFDTE